MQIEVSDFVYNPIESESGKSTQGFDWHGDNCA